MQLKKHWLLLILLLALFLRLYHLDSKAPGTDEQWSIVYAEDTLSGKYYETIEEYTYPPIFNYVLAFTMQLTGKSHYALQFLMVLFGVLSVYLVYLLTKELFTKKIALLTAFLLAINPFHIMYSQHIRSYIFLMVLFLLATLLFYYYIKTNKVNYLYWLTLVYVISFYTHVFAAFYVITHFIIAFILYCTKSFKLKPYLISMGVTTLLCALWLPILFQQATTFVPAAATLDLLGIHNWYIIPHIFYKYAMTVDVSTTLTNFSYFFILFGIISIVFLHGCYTLLNKNTTKGVFLVLSLFLPIGILVFLSFIFPLYSFRYSVYLFPIYLLLLVQGIEAIQHKLLKKSVLLLTILTWFSLLIYYYTISLEPKWNIAIAI
tara:strand:- start:31718 stop:32845 length:1128 start_codon:yes stop_codon:yes gene_type:complete